MSSQGHSLTFMSEDIQIPPKQEQKEKHPILDKIKEFLGQYYFPAYSLEEADLHLSTQEIYSQLQKLYPSYDYSPETVAQWMHELRFIFQDFGDMKLEWLMKKR